jgi:hypothetical protein
MRLTAEPPAPPTPITLILAVLSTSLGFTSGISILHVFKNTYPKYNTAIKTSPYLKTILLFNQIQLVFEGFEEAREETTFFVLFGFLHLTGPSAVVEI